MADMMTFPDAVEEFMEQYKMTDTKQVYSNGIEYVPIFRMEQWFEHEKTQLSQEGTTSDMISRQAALDIFDDYNVSVENGELEAYSRDRKRLCDLPPIQPVATDTNVGDTISRQAAIDALDFEIVHMTAYCDGKNEGNPLAQYNKGLEDGKKAIEALPPAQPETLTDKEQRIFLAAMGREEKVCRQVDDECGDCRDSDSLVRTCHEITRKVKGTLWT